jgi:hypothetical protein
MKFGQKKTIIFFLSLRSIQACSDCDLILPLAEKQTIFKASVNDTHLNIEYCDKHFRVGNVSNWERHGLYSNFNLSISAKSESIQKTFMSDTTLYKKPVLTLQTIRTFNKRKFDCGCTMPMKDKKETKKIVQKVEIKPPSEISVISLANQNNTNLCLQTNHNLPPNSRPNEDNDKNQSRFVLIAHNC